MLRRGGRLFHGEQCQTPPAPLTSTLPIRYEGDRGGSGITPQMSHTPPQVFIPRGVSPPLPTVSRFNESSSSVSATSVFLNSLDRTNVRDSVSGSDNTKNKTRITPKYEPCYLLLSSTFVMMSESRLSSSIQFPSCAFSHLLPSWTMDHGSCEIMRNGEDVRTYSKCVCYVCFQKRYIRK